MGHVRGLTPDVARWAGRDGAEVADEAMTVPTMADMAAGDNPTQKRLHNGHFASDRSGHDWGQTPVMARVNVSTLVMARPNVSRQSSAGSPRRRRASVDGMK